MTKVLYFTEKEELFSYYESPSADKTYAAALPNKWVVYHKDPITDRPNIRVYGYLQSPDLQKSKSELEKVLSVLEPDEIIFQKI